MNQKEVWKDVKNYEGLYQVSNLGRVKSLDRMVKHSSKNRKIFIQKGRDLKPSINSNGYKQFRLSWENKSKTFLAHKLVAQSFLNHITDGTNKLVVDHIDNDKLNNNVINLQIITNRENCSKDKKGKHSSLIGVTKLNNMFIAQIYIKGKNKYLGSFKKEIDAHNEYIKELNNI